MKYIDNNYIHHLLELITKNIISFDEYICLLNNHIENNINKSEFLRQTVETKKLIDNEELNKIYNEPQKYKCIPFVYTKTDGSSSIITYNTIDLE